MLTRLHITLLSFKISFISIQTCLVFLSLFFGKAILISEAATPLQISAPKNYLGGMNESGYKYSVSLHLLTQQGFALHEELTLPNGKINMETKTGLWHQVLDGFTIQLTNNYDYYKLLNVGAIDNLYISCQLPSGQQRTVVLRMQPPNMPLSLTMAGILHFSENKAWLLDMGSGLTYQLKGQCLKDFRQNNLSPQKRQYEVSVEIVTSINTTFLNVGKITAKNN